MAKKTKKEKATKEAAGSKSTKAASKNKKTAGAKKTTSPNPAAPDITEVARKVKAKAADLASNPLVAEVVAATLVAAAAALRDPKKARAMAASAGDELGKAAKGTEAGGALWQLAMDVAKRSVSAFSETGASDEKPKKRKKST
jgi:hypothetical protein